MKKTLPIFLVVLCVTALILTCMPVSAGTTEVNVALNKPYVFENATMHSKIDDTNGKELTDGNIRALGDQPECCGYSGSTKFSMIIDLGKKTSDIKRFALHTTANQSWAVGKLGSVEVLICDTPDGEYRSVGVIAYADAVAGEETWGWSPSVYGLTLAESVSARYIKFDMVPSAANGFGYFWGSEVQVIAVVKSEESKTVSKEESKAVSKEESKAVCKEESKAVSKEESKTVSKEESVAVSVEESVAVSAEESAAVSVEESVAESTVSETSVAASEPEASVADNSSAVSAQVSAEVSEAVSGQSGDNNNTTWYIVGAVVVVALIAAAVVIGIKRKK